MLFSSDILLIYSTAEEGLRQSFSECLSFKDLEMISPHFKLPVGKVLLVVGNKIDCREKAEITKSVGESMTSWRRWLEESISMVTAGFAKARGEVKEACCLFLALVQLGHKLQYWQDIWDGTKQNYNEVRGRKKCRM